MQTKTKYIGGVSVVAAITLGIAIAFTGLAQAQDKNHDSHGGTHDHGGESKPAADGGHQLAEQSLDVPVEFRNQLSQLVRPYLTISLALSADDAKAATNAVAGLHQTVGTINAQSLTGKAAERWKSERNSLSAITAQLSKANDLESLRSAFALLSDELLMLQRVFGLAGSDRLFELHCPMAFEGRGASWIQDDDAVRNPYYGASMISCADKVEPLGEKALPDEHVGHNHD